MIFSKLSIFMQKNRNRLALVFLALVLVNITVRYLSYGMGFQRSDVYPFFYNSDTLFQYQLFWDIFSRGGEIKDWTFTPAPYFFPDFLILLFAWLIGPNTYSQIILFALIQVAFTFVALWFIAKQTKTSDPFITATIILLTVVWLGLKIKPLPGAFHYIFILGYHYGAFLAGMLFVGLWIKYNNKYFYLPIMAAIAFASTLSDNLFFVQVIAPLIGMQVLVAIAERDFSFKNKLPLILVTISSVLGSISYRRVMTRETFLIDIDIDRLHSRLQWLYKLLSKGTVRSILYFIIFSYLCVVLYSFIRLMRAKLANRGSREYSKEWLALFSFLSCCIMLSIILMTHVPTIDRYLIPVFFWPVIVVFIFLNSYLRQRFISVAIINRISSSSKPGKRLVLSLLTVAFMAVSVLALTSMSRGTYKSVKRNGIHMEYYPEYIACMDDVLEKENLDNGLATYWEHRPLPMFSRLNLNIALVHSDLSENHWLTSRKYFRQSHDFALAKKTDKAFFEKLTALNGTPKRVKACGDLLLHVYGKDKIRTKAIDKVGDSYTWKVCKPTDTCEGVKLRNWTAKSGEVTYDIFEALPTGQYSFEISYTNSASKQEAAGSFDIVLVAPGNWEKRVFNVLKKDKVLKNISVSGTDGKTEKLVVTLALDFGEYIHVRTSNADLKINYIRVERIQ